jgi:polyhydroxyalkanoate synthesis regulator phasin
MSTESSQNDTPNRMRRNAALGVTAGLLGGGAIGLLMTVPSFTSAASDDSGSVVAPVVALQDEGVEAPESERPEPGVQLRTMLQELVDAGTIDAGQADAITEHLMENRPERGDRHGGHHRRGPARDGEVTAQLLGIDVEALRDELKAGNSIADIAVANGVDPQTVIDALIIEAEGHVDLMVEDGRLTDDEATTMKERIAERVTARVNGERPGRG